MNDAASDASELAALLSSTDLEPRRTAAERLARMAEDAAPAAAALVRACGDADEQVREHAVAALEDLGPPPTAAVPGLVGLVDHPHPLVGYWATTLLGRAGADAASAVPALTKCLDSRADLAVRQRAAWALGQVGPSATAACETLRRAASQSDERLARLASEALAAIGG